MAKKTKTKKAKAKASKGITASITAAKFVKDWRTYMAEIQAKQKEERKKLLNKLKTTSAELYAKGITSFSCEYSGEGDSGDMHYTYYEKNPAFGDKKAGDIPEDVMTDLRELAWKFVPDGFENNDGGFGEIVIDFATSTIKTRHSDRIVEVETNEKEFNFDGEEQ